MAMWTAVCGADWEKGWFFNRVKLITNIWLLKREG